MSPILDTYSTHLTDPSERQTMEKGESNLLARPERSSPPRLKDCSQR